MSEPLRLEHSTSRKPVVFERWLLQMLRRGDPFSQGKWIGVTTVLVLLTLTCLLIVISRNEPAPDERSHMLWIW